MTHPEVSSLKDELTRINYELAEAKIKVNKLEDILTPLLPLVSLVTATSTKDSALTHQALTEAASLVDTLSTEIIQRLHCEFQVIIYNIPYKIPAMKAAQLILKACDLDAKICRCFRMRKNSSNSCCPLLIEFDNSSVVTELMNRQRMISNESSLKNVRISLARTKLQRELKDGKNYASTITNNKFGRPLLDHTATAVESHTTAPVLTTSPTFIGGSSIQQITNKPSFLASQLPATCFNTSAPATPKYTNTNNNIDLDDAMETPTNSDVVMSHSVHSHVSTNPPSVAKPNCSAVSPIYQKLLLSSDAPVAHKISLGNVSEFEPKDPSKVLHETSLVNESVLRINKPTGCTITLHSLLPPVDLSKPSSILGEPPHPIRKHPRTLAPNLSGLPEEPTVNEAKFAHLRPILPPKPTPGDQQHPQGHPTMQVGYNYRYASQSYHPKALFTPPLMEMNDINQRLGPAPFRLAPTPGWPPPYTHIPPLTLTLPPDQQLMSATLALFNLLLPFLSSLHSPPTPTAHFNY
jgi:hypothetical protein